MALRFLVGKLRGSLPFRAVAYLKEADELDRRMIRNSALVAVTSIGIFTFTMRSCAREIVEMSKLNDKKQAFIRLREKIYDLDDLPNDEAKAKALSRILQRFVDLGEGEAVASLLEEAEKMEKARGDATGATKGGDADVCHVESVLSSTLVFLALYIFMVWFPSVCYGLLCICVSYQ